MDDERLKNDGLILTKKLKQKDDDDVRKHTNDSRKSCSNYVQIEQKNSKYIGQVNLF